MQEKFRKYLNSKSKWAIASDVLFVILIIAMLIPGPRKAIMVGVKRIAMFSPAETKTSNRSQLDYKNNSWTLQSIDGEVVQLSELKGKVLFINFWATWCPPCIAEMPAIQKLYDQYKNNPDIVFLFVTDDKTDQVKDFMTRHQYNLPVYRSLDVIPEELQTRSIPKTYLIDKEGSIVISKTGSAKWDSKKMFERLDNMLGLSQTR